MTGDYLKRTIKQNLTNHGVIDEGVYAVRSSIKITSSTQLHSLSLLLCVIDAFCVIVLH